MSAYKTVNKRADPKRNFTASLACSGYSGKSKKRRVREREIEADFREIKEGKTRRIMREKEKEKKCIRKDKTNREIERMRGIEEREKIRVRAGRAASEPREKKG